MWTNGWHHLVRTDGVRLVEQSGVLVESFPELDRSAAWGPAFWVGWLYSQVLVLATTGLLLWNAVDSHDVFQRQTVAIVVGARFEIGGVRTMPETVP